MEEFIQMYKKSVTAAELCTDKKMREIEQKKRLIADRNSKYSNLSLMGKIVRFYSKERDDSRDTQDIYERELEMKSERRTQAQALRKLILVTGRHLMDSSSSVSDVIEVMETQHSSLLQIQSSISKTYRSGKAALQSIRHAKSTVSSAQTIETFDLVTDSEAISLLSTLENSSVSNEINNAKHAVSVFNERLEDHQQVVTSIQHTSTIEYLDLSLDLFLGGVFDLVGSVISLFALSDASNKLFEAEQQVSKVLDTIKPAYEKANHLLKKHEDEMLETKNKERLKVIPFLGAHGIIVSNEEVLKIKDLYAN